MLRVAIILRSFFAIIIFFLAKNADAQTCIADYFSINYKGESAQTINKTITADNEIILAGNIPTDLL